MHTLRLLLGLSLAGCLALLLGSSTPPTPTATLTGTVFDETGNPVIGGSVSVYRGEDFVTGTMTDFDGHYRISLDTGRYDVVFAYVGYEELRVEGFEVHLGPANRLDTAFSNVGVDLDEVVVTAYKVDPMNVHETTQGLTYSSHGLRARARQRPARRKARRDQLRGVAQSSSPTTPAPARIQQGNMNKLSKLACACVLAGCTHEAGYVNADVAVVAPPTAEARSPYAGESYPTLVENAFALPRDAPLSTFGADVDVASYANVRRFISDGHRPPSGAVRTEELVNYFDYDYPAPTGNAPVAFATELGECPWNRGHQLLHIGLQARQLDDATLPPSNLVFLIDVSGSMNSPNKLPLLKQGYRLLAERLRPQDKVSIVVYAGAAGVVLEPTAGDDKRAITSAINKLSAGGSTAGAAGIKLAYQLAERNFVAGGNNRIILATDGDFNVGTTDNQTLEDYVDAKRQSGVFLSVLGFGTGNYRDARMQVLAEHGDGNAAYIDNLLEARKVLVEEFGGTLFTVAKDVKLQVEFNPAHVAAYRLLGYESRLLAPEDFNDDTKDAGDMGSGHTVTALYELIPAGTESDFLPSVEALKYQAVAKTPGTRSPSDELATVRMKYKHPDDARSQDKVEVSVGATAQAFAKTSNAFQWSAAVAGWSLLLRDSRYLAPEFGYPELLPLARASRKPDERGYRAECLRLMRAAAELPAPELLVEANR